MVLAKMVMVLDRIQEAPISVQENKVQYQLLFRQKNIAAVTDGLLKTSLLREAQMELYMGDTTAAIAVAKTLADFAVPGIAPESYLELLKNCVFHRDAQVRQVTLGVVQRYSQKITAFIRKDLHLLSNREDTQVYTQNMRTRVVAFNSSLANAAHKALMANDVVNAFAALEMLHALDPDGFDAFYEKNIPNYDELKCHYESVTVLFEKMHLVQRYSCKQQWLARVLQDGATHPQVLAIARQYLAELAQGPY